jgi:eukaryotic-like serine/threonine-protein kinase
MAVAWGGLLLAGLIVAWLSPGLGGARTDGGAHGRDRVAIGDTVSAAAVMLAPMRTDGTTSVIGLPMPEKPFPGQRTPPCTRHGEVVIRGGCWYELARAPPPCKEDAYDWNGACYLPSYPARRQQTSQPQ